MPAPPRGELFEVEVKFLVALDTLATGLTACALSVTCGDSSPKGRAKSTAGNFLFIPNTLAMKLYGLAPPSGELARERLRGFAP